MFDTVLGAVLAYAFTVRTFDVKPLSARGIGIYIFAQGKSIDDLMENIKEAVGLHFEDLLLSGEDIRVLSISEFEVYPVAKASSS